MAPRAVQAYGKAPGAYGNHDLANRQQDMDIEYIVIHDTEATYDTTLDLVSDPTYVVVALHDPVGRRPHRPARRQLKTSRWHAGNWYVNMHSIGLEHEGFAATGADWYTESLYQSSAKLVRHLSQKYGVPLDRAHIIGHDQVPGILPAQRPGMHWDPGPYWDWEHYFDLLGAPITADGAAGSSRGHGGTRLRRQRPAGDRVRPGPADVDAVPGPGHELRLPLQPARPGRAVRDRRRAVHLDPDAAPVHDVRLRHRRPCGGRPEADRGAGPGRLGPGVVAR